MQLVFFVSGFKNVYHKNYRKNFDIISIGRWSFKCM